MLTRRRFWQRAAFGLRNRDNQPGRSSGPNAASDDACAASLRCQPLKQIDAHWPSAPEAFIQRANDRRNSPNPAV
jgi:hypothetical protein